MTAQSLFHRGGVGEGGRESRVVQETVKINKSDNSKITKIWFINRVDNVN